MLGLIEIVGVTVGFKLMEGRYVGNTVGREGANETEGLEVCVGRRDT